MKRIAIIVLMGVLVGCSGGSGGNNGGGNNGGSGGEVNSTLRVLASNVMLSSGSAAVSKTTGDVDTTTKVVAENVMLDTAAGNILTSDNLQAALNNELAVNLTTEIVGYWSVENAEPTSTGFRNLCNASQTQTANYNAPGTVVFASGGTYAVCSGRFAVAGLEPGDAQYVPTSYAVKDSGTIIFNMTATSVATSVPAVATNVSVGSITMISGGGGCGEAVGMRYSKLTRISTAETCP